MLTFYSIRLLTTDVDGDPVEETHFAPYLDDVETLLQRRMNAGDTALVYQLDAPPPKTPEEAVDWLKGEERLCLQVLVAEATRHSDHEAPILTPTEMASLSGFMCTTLPEAQA